MSNRYKILAEASGKLTEEEVRNLEEYGVKHPSEFALTQQTKCLLLHMWEKDCDEEYEHWTSER